MWCGMFEKLIPGVLDTFETIIDILVKSLERDATMVDWDNFFYDGISMLVISCESKCYIIFRDYLI